MITLECLKNAIADIKETEKEWVNDSHSKAKYEGACQGLDMLFRHFKEYQMQKNWRKKNHDNKLQ